VLGFLKAICKEFGIAVICNLHQVEYALEFAERIIGLSNGHIVFDDTPDNLTLEVVQSIYPGLDDPGMTRLLRSERAQRVASIPRVATA
jgi:phosphonate transport system ATP-binding protein